MRESLSEAAKLLAPDPRECRGSGDIGKLHHDVEQDIWYECVHDERTGVFTWTILPPADDQC